jgi:Arc/MetJ-type ribon-helix-helix transcriptional regulator
MKSGRYRTRAEVVNGALALMQSQQEQAGADELAELRARIAVGIEQADRGELEDWDIDDLRAEGKRLLSQAKETCQRRARRKRAG